MLPVWYTVDDTGALLCHPHPPQGMCPLDQALAELQPSTVGQLHQAFRRWLQAGHAPGPLAPDRVWVDGEGRLALRFGLGRRPRTLDPMGSGPHLAAWLVLLDHFVDTSVVVARARPIWPLDELAEALSFTAPAFLPSALVGPGTSHWEAVAHALARVVGDGFLGRPTGGERPRRLGPSLSEAR